MTHRQYPNPDRARHQIDRHTDETPPQLAPRPMTPFERQFLEGAAAMMRAATPALTEAGARLKSALSQRPVRPDEEPA